MIMIVCPRLICSGSRSPPADVLLWRAPLRTYFFSSMCFVIDTGVACHQRGGLVFAHLQGNVCCVALQIRKQVSMLRQDIRGHVREPQDAEGRAMYDFRDLDTRSPSHEASPRSADIQPFRRGDDTVGNPHRAQFFQFELFELILLLKLDRQFSVEQFEPSVSQSTVPSPPSKTWNFSAAIRASCPTPGVGAAQARARDDRA